MYMASCFEITDEIASYPPPIVALDPDTLVKILQNSTKFKAFFDGFGFHTGHAPGDNKGYRSHCRRTPIGLCRDRSVSAAHS